MTISTVGYDGTVSELQWAQIMHLVGVEYAVGGATHWQISGIAARKVQAAIGQAYGNGVLVTNSAADAASQLTIPTPAAGGWYLVCLRRDWAANTSTLVAIASTTGADAVAGARPALPAKGTAGGAAFTGNPGVLDDQPLAWVWARASTATLEVFDLRTREISAPQPELEVSGTTNFALVSGFTVISNWPTTDRQTLLPSLVNGVFTCDRAGLYAINAFLRLAVGSGINGAAQILKNATIIAEDNGASTTTFGLAVTIGRTVRLAVGDTLSVRAARTAGDMTNRSLSIEYLGA